MSIGRRELMAGLGALSAAPIALPAAAKARRASRPDAVAALRDRLKGRLYTPSDSLYHLASRGLGTTPVEDRAPAVVVLPETPEDIARALDFARNQQLEVSVRSGGHDLLGASTTANGVLIDLSRLNAVSIDPATGVAQAGAGARAGDLNTIGAPSGWAPVLGMNPHIGLGGLTLGGGIGWLCGSHGATVDHVLAVDVVTADGRLLRADAEHNPDLFWALRGGGGNFGVATAFTYSLQPVSHVLAGDLACKAEPARFLRFLRGFLADSPDALDLGVQFTLGQDPTALVRLCWSGAPDEGERALAPLRGFAPALVDNIRLQSYVSFANSTPASRFDNMFLRGGEFDGLDDRVIEAFAAVIDKGGPKDCMVGVLHYMHGALCRAPADSTPLIRAQGHILYNIVAPWQGPTRQLDKVDWALATSEALKAVNSKQTYINYLSFSGDRYVRDAFGPHYGRLRAVKRKYDPDNVFHNNRNIRV